MRYPLVRNVLPILAMALVPVATLADVAPVAPETPPSEEPRTPAEFSLGPIVLFGVDGALISTETVSSVDGDVTIARIRPWDATRHRVVETSWASVAVYPRGLTLPDGSRADASTATEYTLEYVSAGLQRWATVSRTASTVPVAGSPRDAVRLDATRDDATAQITVGTFAVGDALVVFTMFRNEGDGAYFAPLRDALDRIERVAHSTNEVP